MIKETNEIKIKLGFFMFEFTSQIHWVNKAQSWFSNLNMRPGDYIAIDSAGRICTMGKHFMRATKEKTYPIKVYCIEVL